MKSLDFGELIILTVVSTVAVMFLAFVGTQVYLAVTEPPEIPPHIHEADPGHTHPHTHEITPAGDLSHGN